jgi:hypothetical protein
LWTTQGAAAAVPDDFVEDVLVDGLESVVEPDFDSVVDDEDEMAEEDDLLASARLSVR